MRRTQSCFLLVFLIGLMGLINLGVEEAVSPVFTAFDWFRLITGLTFMVLGGAAFIFSGDKDR